MDASLIPTSTVNLAIARSNDDDEIALQHKSTMVLWEGLRELGGRRRNRKQKERCPTHISSGTARWQVLEPRPTQRCNVLSVRANGSSALLVPYGPSEIH